MKLKQKKIENTVKIRSYMDIRKREVFGGQKTGAKILDGAGQRVFQELSSYWRLKGLIGAKLLRLKGKVILKKGFAFITIIAVIVTAYFQGTPQANAATFTLYQTAWNSVNASESHSGNSQTEIKTYSAKDTNLNIVDGGVNDDSLTSPATRLPALTLHC